MVHVAAISRGHPVRLTLTPGQSGGALLTGLRPRSVVADCWYDSGATLDHLRRLRAKAVIPRMPGRRV